MTDRGTWFTRMKLEDPNLNANASQWKNLTTDFLLNVDTTENDVEFQRSSLPRKKHHVSMNGLPKEQQVTEAMRLRRQEKFSQLAKIKETKIINQEIRYLRENLENVRSLQNLSLGNSGETHKRNMVRKVHHDSNKRWGAWNVNHSATPNTLDIWLDARKYKEAVKNGCYQPEKTIIGEKHVTLEDENAHLSETEIIAYESFIIKTESIETLTSTSEGNMPRKKVIVPPVDNIKMEVNSKNPPDVRLAALENRIRLLRITHFWIKWKQYIKGIKDEKRWKEKIDCFVEGLHQYSKEETEKKKVATEKKHRRHTAPLMKAKSDEKDSDLKKISDAVEKSAAETRQLLRSKSAQKYEPSLRGKAKLISIITTTMSNNNYESDRIPMHFPEPMELHEMNKKHQERKDRLREIQDKKKLLEEEKDRIAKEKYEQQLLQAELKKRQKLEEFRQKLRKQRIAQEKQRREWLRMQSLTAKADHHHRYRLLTKYGWFPLQKLVERRRELNEHADIQNERRIKRIVLRLWRSYVEEMIETKVTAAAAIWGKCLLRQCFTRWRQECEQRKLKHQVAEDWYELNLVQQTFDFWQQYMIFERYSFERSWSIAAAHYRRYVRIMRKELTKYLKQWMLLPQVIYLEKEKELRKDDLRQKVRQVLPDFIPMQSSLGP